MESNSNSNTKSIVNNIYYNALLNRNIEIPFTHIGKNINEIISKYLKNIEGKCSVEGYIKNNSIKIVNYSSGLLKDENVKFNVNFECDICNPSEGIIISSQVLNVSKAGIRAILNNYDENNSPLMIFIIREHNYNNEIFNNVNKDDIINVKIVGTRFELNDKNITVIGELI